MTLPAGGKDLGVSYGFLDASDDVSDSTVLKYVSLGTTFGLSDKAEIRLRYSACTDCDFLDDDGSNFKGAIDAEFAYDASSGGALHIAPTLGLGYDFLEEAVAPIDIGVRIRYNINDKFSLYSAGKQLNVIVDGTPLGALTTFADAAVAGPAAGSLPASVDLRDLALLVTLPIGIGYQVAPQVFVGAATELGQLVVLPYDNYDKPFESLWLFTDYVPLSLAAVVSATDKIEVGVTYDTELKLNDGHVYHVGAFVRALL